MVGFAWLLANATAEAQIQDRPQPLVDKDSGSAARQTAAAADDQPVPSDTPPSAGGAGAGVGAGLADDRDGEAVVTATCKPDEQLQGLLDRTQASLYRALCGTTMWFDGFFGDPAFHEGTSATYGQLNLGAFWDQRDGFDTRTRLRVRLALPALEERANVFIGRGNAEDIIDGSDNRTFETGDRAFRDLDDEDLLVGLGYNPSTNARSGFGLDGGVKVSLPLDPFVGVNYRLYRDLSDRWSLQLRNRAFWRNSEGPGASVSADLNYSSGQNWLFRAASFLRGGGSVEELRWVQSVTAFRRVTDRQAWSYAIFGEGETGEPVEIRDYGMEVRFRRRVLRQWLILELVSSVSWPREFVDEVRQTNIGIGFEFEIALMRQ
jgi:hypothetical protein